MHAALLLQGCALKHEIHQHGLATTNGTPEIKPLRHAWFPTEQPAEPCLSRRERGEVIAKTIKMFKDFNLCRIAINFAEADKLLIGYAGPFMGNATHSSRP